MEGLSYLEDRVDQEPVLKLRVMLNKEVKHHLTEFVLDTGREIVKQPEKILKADQLREVLGCGHHFNQ